jgi:hypothetical protein
LWNTRVRERGAFSTWRRGYARRLNSDPRKESAKRFKSGVEACFHEPLPDLHARLSESSLADGGQSDPGVARPSDSHHQTGVRTQNRQHCCYFLSWVVFDPRLYLHSLPFSEVGGIVSPRSITVRRPLGTFPPRGPTSTSSPESGTTSPGLRVPLNSPSTGCTLTETTENSMGVLFDPHRPYQPFLLKRKEFFYPLAP